MTQDEAKRLVIEKIFQILLSLLDLVGSKKFLVALGAGIGAYQTTGEMWALITPLVTYIVAQGVSDIGKERAKVENGQR